MCFYDRNQKNLFILETWEYVASWGVPLYMIEYVWYTKKLT